MNAIKNIGLGLFIISIVLLFYTLSISNFSLTSDVLRSVVSNDEHHGLMEPVLSDMFDRTYDSRLKFIDDYKQRFDKLNEGFKSNDEWGKVIWTDYTFALVKESTVGSIFAQRSYLVWLTFFLACVGALMNILPALKEGPSGIKNNGTFHRGSQNRGWIGIITGTLLILFYIFLYKKPEYITNWVILLDPLSEYMNGGSADQWFLYGFLYCLAMLVMGVRMMIKYRHNNYQLIRTGSVLFFQLAFAFTIPQILKRLHMPAYDLKSAWPLEYTFFFDYRLDEHIQAGSFGIWMLGWGIALFVIGVPLFTYIYGKRWYCSWVCGCGGLAETLGDPYRHLSDKSVRAWKIERWIVHLVLVYAVVMTVVVIYSYIFGSSELLGISSYAIRDNYGFAIGFVFAGVVGTGFYPLMGNRMWCRFGCPLAAYLGLIQRFKSRFRITTNGGQCISCGNCSTYCEMGIDVRWYAQRGQNIVRSSCVGCGVCSAVCPRGVLKLENGPEVMRVNDNPILIGNDGVTLAN